MRSFRSGARRGQIMIIAIMCLLVLAIMLPVMVMYTRTESNWSVKDSQSTQAFHLAESGIEKAYLEISLSTQNWITIQNGGALADYHFDKSYTAVGAGGSYAISISSGPGTQQATIISVGRDIRKREVRAIMAVYTNSPLGGIAIYAGKGAQIGNGVSVEWGGVVSPNIIDPGGAAHPQFWSASSIVGFDTNPTPPNCDSPACCQWHSFMANMPPAPTLDLGFYASSAAASNCSGMGGGTQSPAGSCYFSGSVTTDHTWSGVSGKTIYVDGDLNVTSSGKLDVVGNLLVTGNVNLPSGAWGQGSHIMNIPSDGWKQYCNDWAFYKSNFDGGAPSSFPGLNASYAPTGLTHSSSKLAVYGLLYVGGNFNNGGGGGGNSDVYGALYSMGSSSETAHSAVTIYFDADAAKNLQTTQIILTRASWQDSNVGWPSALP